MRKTFLGILCLIFGAPLLLFGGSCVMLNVDDFTGIANWTLGLVAGAGAGLVLLSIILGALGAREQDRKAAQSKDAPQQ